MKKKKTCKITLAIVALFVAIAVAVSGCGHNIISYQQGKRIGTISFSGESNLPSLTGYFDGESFVAIVREHVQVSFERDSELRKLTLITDSQINGYTVELEEVAK